MCDMQTRCARPSEMARDPRAGRRQAASAPDRRNPRATSCGPLLRQAVALLLTALTTACGKQNTLDLQYYYEYDRDLPLQVRTDSLAVRKWHISFDSVHQQRVPAVLTLPARGTPPYPAVIMLHGLGDHKEQDYMAIGDSIFSAAGFAVLRPDFALHGERRVPDLGEKRWRNAATPSGMPSRRRFSTCAGRWTISKRERISIPAAPVSSVSAWAALPARFSAA